MSLDSVSEIMGDLAVVTNQFRIKKKIPGGKWAKFYLPLLMTQIIISGD